MKMLNIISYITVLITLSFLLTCGYWLFYPYKTVVAKNNPYPLLKKELKPGDPIGYHSSTCRLVDADVILQPTIVGEGVLINLPQFKYAIKKECIERDNLSNIIPSYLPHGTYKLTLTSYIKVNPIRTIEATFETEEFIIK